MLCPASTYTYRNGYLEIAKNVIFSSNSYMEISRHIYKVKHFKKKKSGDKEKSPWHREYTEVCQNSKL